ncbi:MAG: hypothetical protein QFX35_01195 [Candidatus Verstraetearchaeota archaeon]|nr:hypothetical protein [Candidatus Verstraetearchaeota archaeon]
MHFIVPLGYIQSLCPENGGSRNGSLRRLGSLKRGLLKCALEYSRRCGSVSSPRHVGSSNYSKILQKELG